MLCLRNNNINESVCVELYFLIRSERLTHIGTRAIK